MSNYKKYSIDLEVKYKPLEIIDVSKMAATCSKKWQNLSLCNVNDSVVRLAVIEGEFHWHKHEKEDEFFVQVQGSSTIVVDDGHGLEEIALSGLNNAIFLPTKVWHHFKNLSDNCVILALTSTNYDPDRSDYCENYEDFQKLVNKG